jgi:hypothetical protein
MKKIEKKAQKEVWGGKFKEKFDEEMDKLEREN